MLLLKLKEPFDQVFVGLRLENPLTGESTIVDAKIDTGSIITLIPMSVVSGMGFEVLGEEDYTAANNTLIHTYVIQSIASLSAEDVFDVPVHVCKERSDIALVGMDILKKCNYAQWHEWNDDDEHSLNFKLEIAEKD